VPVISSAWANVSSSPDLVVGDSIKGAISVTEQSSHIEGLTDILPVVSSAWTKVSSSPELVVACHIELSSNGSHCSHVESISDILPVVSSAWTKSSTSPELVVAHHKEISIVGNHCAHSEGIPSLFPIIASSRASAVTSPQLVVRDTIDSVVVDCERRGSNIEGFPNVLPSISSLRGERGDSLVNSVSGDYVHHLCFCF